MGKNCSRCGRQLSFKDSFVWEKRPVCGNCLKDLEQGQRWEEISEPSKYENSTEDMVEEIITMEDVLNMSKAGLSENIIIEKIRSSNIVNLSTDDIIEWKNKGISETIIQESLKERKAPKEMHAEITGKIRNPWGVLGLAIITLGIYLLVWIYKVHEEVRDHSKSGHDISPGLALGLCFIPIFNFIWLCIILGKLVHRVNMMQSEDGYEKIADPGWPVFWYLVGLGTSFIYIPLSLVSFVLVQNALNKHWKWHNLKHRQ